VVNLIFSTMNINKIPGIFAILIAAIFLASLFKNDLFSDPYIQAKYYYFSFLFIPILFILIYNGLKAKKESLFKFTLLDLVVLAFYIYTVTRYVLTPVEKLLSPDILVHSSLIVLYLMLKTALQNYTGIQTKTFTRFLFTAIIIVLLLNSFYGLLQQIKIAPPAHPKFKVGGAFGNPGPYSNFIDALSPVCLAVLFKREIFQKWLFNLSILTLIATLSVLPFTMARTAWVCFALIVLLFVGDHLKKTKKGKRMFNSMLLKISATMLVIFFFASFIYYLYGIKKESATGRLFIWELTTKIIKDKPVFGHGTNSFCYQLNNYQAEYFNQFGGYANKAAQTADNATYAFNEFLQIASESGLIGLTLFILLMVFSLKSRLDKKNTNNKDRKLLCLVAKITLIAIMVCCLFSYPLHNIVVLSMFYIALAIISANDEGLKKPLLILNANSCKVLTFFILLCSGYVYYLIFNRYTGEKEWGQLLKEKRTLPSEALFQKYEELLPVMSYNKYFLYNYGSELIASKQFQKGVSILEPIIIRLNDSNIYTYLGYAYYELHAFDKSENYFKHASDIVPSKLFPLYNLVKVYKKTGRDKEAIELARKIIQMGEKVETDIGNGILIEMNEYLAHGKLKN
jgi:O-antigen polymerase